MPNPSPPPPPPNPDTHNYCHLHTLICLCALQTVWTQLIFQTLAYQTVWKSSWSQWERSGLVVECFTRDRGAAGSSLTGVTALWSLSKNINPSLVLVQPRKTRPSIIERLLMGGKESNQTDKSREYCSSQIN